MKNSLIILSLIIISGCCSRDGYYNNNNRINEYINKSYCEDEKDKVLKLVKYQCKNPNMSEDDTLKHSSKLIREYQEHFHGLLLSKKEIKEDCESIMRDKGGMYDYYKYSLSSKVYDYCLQENGLKYGARKTISSTCPIGKPIGF